MLAFIFIFNNFVIRFCHFIFFCFVLYCYISLITFLQFICSSIYLQLMLFYFSSLLSRHLNFLSNIERPIFYLISILRIVLKVVLVHYNYHLGFMNNHLLKGSNKSHFIPYFFNILKTFFSLDRTFFEFSLDIKISLLDS